MRPARLTSPALLLSLLALPGAALASPPDEGPPAPPSPESLHGGVPAQPDSLGALYDALRIAQMEGDRSEAQHLEALIQVATQLLDETLSLEARQGGAQSLGELGDPRGLVFLGAASREQNPPLQIAALKAAAAFTTPEAADLGARRLRDPDVPRSVQEAAVTLLKDLGSQAAAQALWAVAQDESIPDPRRSMALQALREAYPAFLEGREAPAVTASWVGNALFSAGAATTGGVFFSAVGQWGQLDNGPVLGGLAGGAIGAGSGYLYARRNPVELGQGMMAGSAVGWGLTAGQRAASALQTQGEVSAALRVVGTGLGAYYGYRRMERNPSPSDVVEVDIAGWLGAETAVGLTRLALSLGEPSEEAIARAPSAAALGGAAVGLGAGWALKEGWDLSPQALAYAGVAGFQGGWVGGWLPSLLDQERLEGTLRLGLHAGAAAGLVVAELRETTWMEVRYGGYGVALGNTLGAGLPLLAGVEEDQPVLGAMSALGTLGLVGGTAIAPAMNPTRGDTAMVGVGIPLGLLNGFALGYVLSEETGFTNRQWPGLTLTLGASTGLGLSALGTRVDPEAADMVFMGSAAAWGAWYGAMTPLALGTQQSDSGRVLLTTLVADAFLFGGGILTVGPPDLDPRATVIPQLGGLTGATLGALGAALVTDDAQTVALGAVLGSTAGLGAGALIENIRDTDRSGGAEAALHHLGWHVDLPGVWLPTLSAYVDDEGRMGPQLGLQVVGW